MKLASITQTFSVYPPRFGILLDNNRFLDINLLWQLHYQKKGVWQPDTRANHTHPSSLHAFLNAHLEPLDILLSSLEMYRQYEKSGDLCLKSGHSILWQTNGQEAQLTRPIDHIHCYRDFFAHEKHVKTGFAKRGEEIPQAWYDIAAYYKGATAGFIGPEEEILWPEYTSKLDYELELGAIMARDGFNIKADQALKYVLGFTILNDISARDIQKSEMAIRLGPAKGKDFCSVIGPVIVTVDEFNFQQPNLKMTATINGELWSQGQSGDAYWDFSEMIEHASREEWVCASDFMGSGTVGTGCGLEIDKWIQPNDVIELEIEKIGILKNIVGKPRKNYGK